MAFISVPGIKGQLYVPDEVPERVRKHHCPDCSSCMICSDDKCAMCLDQTGNDSADEIETRSDSD